VETLSYPLLDRFISDDTGLTDASSFAECVTRDVLDNIKHILQTTLPPRLTAFSQNSDSENPYTENSVLNYGIPPFIGGMGSDASAKLYSESVRKALLSGEPRIEASTLVVDMIHLEEDSVEILGSDFQFSISAQISVLKNDNVFTVETRMNPFRVPEISTTTSNFYNTG